MGKYLSTLQCDKLSSNLSMNKRYISLINEENGKNDVDAAFEQDRSERLNTHILHGDIIIIPNTNNFQSKIIEVNPKITAFYNKSNHLIDTKSKVSIALNQFVMIYMHELNSFYQIIGKSNEIIQIKQFHL